MATCAMYTLGTTVKACPAFKAGNILRFVMFPTPSRHHYCLEGSWGCRCLCSSVNTEPAAAAGVGSSRQSLNVVFDAYIHTAAQSLPVA